MAFNGTITGRLGRDPELRYLDGGKVVANFTVAVRQNKQQGQEPPPRWVKVAVWGKSAEYVGNYVRKGDSVYMVGRVEAPEIYTDRQGQVQVAEKFTAENIENWQPRDQQGGGGAALAPAAPPAPAPAAQQAYAAAGYQPAAAPPAPVAQQPAAQQTWVASPAGYQPNGMPEDPPF